MQSAIKTCGCKVCRPGVEIEPGLRGGRTKIYYLLGGAKMPRLKKAALKARRDINDRLFEEPDHEVDSADESRGFARLPTACGREPSTNSWGRRNS